jgi:membrane protease YdiL (CAAX protease family)
MELGADNSLVTYVVSAALASSLITLLLLAQRVTAGHPLLAYRPRSPVPWNVWAPVIVIVPHFVGILMVELAGASREEPAAGGLDAGFAGDAWGVAGGLILFAVACWVVLAAAVGATREDLGFPRSRRELLGDVLVGFVACVAMLLPVLAAQLILQLVFQPESRHPFIEEVLADPSLEVYSAIAFSAVVAAPLFEETAFRLILQGWLQRCEEQSLNPQADECGMGAAAVSTGWLSWPRGWLPIVISSVLFGLAHWGHGVDPYPLILVGMVLGYLFQRTGRLAPCVAAHALFNAYNLAVLGAELYSRDVDAALGPALR